MPRYCTIYSATIDYSLVVGLIRESFLGCSLEVTGHEEAWQQLVVTEQDWTLKLSGLYRDKPGDEFSKLILGTLTFFRNVETSALANKQKVVQHIIASNWAIGVVIEPDFNEEAGHFDFIFDLAARLGGLIFNGWGMIDSEGLMVLDKDGHFDKS